MVTLEEYSGTDSEDEEYVPPGEHVSSCSGSEEEEIGTFTKRKDYQDDDGRARKRRQDVHPKSTKKSKGAQTRKRRGGIKLELSESGNKDDAGSGSESGGSAGIPEGDEEEAEADSAETENVKKSRVDDLWASFKKDVGGPVSSNPSGSLTSPGGRSKSAGVSSSSGGSVSRGGGGGGNTAGLSKDSKTVTIKKSYDFAGEEVVVEEEMPARKVGNCHKRYKQHVVSDEAGSKTTLPVQGLASRAKRSSGLGSVLKSLDKKPKMSTLEKSRLDWQKYKKEEGLQDELEFHAKDGFLERREFLQRTEVRQFEQERDERLKRFKRLH